MQVKLGGPGLKLHTELKKKDAQTKDGDGIQGISVFCMTKLDVISLQSHVSCEEGRGLGPFGPPRFL